MAVTLSGGSIVAAVATRQHEIVERVRNADVDLLLGPSHLPGWDRLTILCHLRYGAVASRVLTLAALEGRPAAFYPAGRHTQRPETLQPGSGESVREVVTSLESESTRLDEAWAPLDDQQWALIIDEPPDNADLGPITLSTLALLRLTEVEVHGHDLNLGLAPWSETFVEAALPMRLHWLPTRRANHREVDQTIDGTWALASTDGPTFLIRASGINVEVRNSHPDAGADATLSGTARELLAFILGRRPLTDLAVSGDLDMAHNFLAAFPAP